ncbi:MAG TPA: hypothetical protein VF442_10705 [Sphingobium sp.]
MLFIAPLLLASPALAQDQDSGEPVFNLPRQTQPPADPNRQGPELNVFRGAPTPVTPPPVVTPTIVPPPAITPAPQPTPQPQPPAATQPQRPAPSVRQPAPTPPPSNAPATPAATPEPQPTPSPEATPAPAAPAAEPPLAPSGEPSRWPWIGAGVAALAALLTAAWLLRRRKRDADEIFEEEPLFAEEGEQAPAPPAATPRPLSPSRPTPPAPVPVPPPPPAPQTADRPWIDLAMEVRGARLSLMGATITYVLTLHNRGQRPAEDLLIRTLIANADTGQQAMLQQFFAGAVGLPTHSVVSVAPGESHSLTGELRLLPDQIAPVQMDGRALLIPLVAFDAQYRWTDEGSEASGAGRTGGAFIVGQEKSPPADRLAPFRLDLGPRQYPTPGSRATALTLAS